MWDDVLCPLFSLSFSSVLMSRTGWSSAGGFRHGGQLCVSDHTQTSFQPCAGVVYSAVVRSSNSLTYSLCQVLAKPSSLSTRSPIHQTHPFLSTMPPIHQRTNAPIHVPTHTPTHPCIHQCTPTPLSHTPRSPPILTDRSSFQPRSALCLPRRSQWPVRGPARHGTEVYRSLERLRRFQPTWRPKRIV